LRIHRPRIGVAALFAVALTGMTTIGPAATSTLAATDPEDIAAQVSDNGDQDADAQTVRLKLTIPSQTLAACMPKADVQVKVKLTTEKRGFDIFDMTARHIAPNRSYTIFLMEKAGPPFGAVEYIGELNTNAEGNGHAEFHLIVQEAFVSTIVNGQRTRADLNQIGVWFADPKDDDFCLGPGGGATPFDGDGESGALVFNSANAAPLPLP
jgi:hypothetical protein